MAWRCQKPNRHYQFGTCLRWATGRVLCPPFIPEKHSTPAPPPPFPDFVTSKILAQANKIFGSVGARNNVWRSSKKYFYPRNEIQATCFFCDIRFVWSAKTSTGINTWLVLLFNASSKLLRTFAVSWSKNRSLQQQHTCVRRESFPFWGTIWVFYSTKILKKKKKKVKLKAYVARKAFNPY